MEYRANGSGPAGRGKDLWLTGKVSRMPAINQRLAASGKARPAGVSGTCIWLAMKAEYGVGYGAGRTDAGGISNDAQRSLPGTTLITLTFARTTGVVDFTRQDGGSRCCRPP